MDLIFLVLIQRTLRLRPSCIGTLEVAKIMSMLHQVSIPTEIGDGVQFVVLSAIDAFFVSELCLVVELYGSTFNCCTNL